MENIYIHYNFPWMESNYGTIILNSSPHPPPRLLQVEGEEVMRGADSGGNSRVRRSAAEAGREEGGDWGCGRGVAGCAEAVEGVPFHCLVLNHQARGFFPHVKLGKKSCLLLK